MRRTGAPAVLGVLLALATWSGCASPEVGVEPRPPGNARISDPVPVAWPDGPTLAAALPGPRQVGGIGGFSSCPGRTEACPGVAVDGVEEWWARASDRSGPEGAARWVEVTVRRHGGAEPAREEVSEAVLACPPGEFGGSGSPQGLRPRAPSYVGVRQRSAITDDGFRGSRCAQGARQPGRAASYDEHVLVAARRHVVLTVAASSEQLAVRLLEEYVDRLGPGPSPR